MRAQEASESKNVQPTQADVRYEGRLKVTGKAKYAAEFATEQCCIWRDGAKHCAERHDHGHGYKARGACFGRACRNYSV